MDEKGRGGKYGKKCECDKYSIALKSPAESSEYAPAVRTVERPVARASILSAILGSRFR